MKKSSAKIEEAAYQRWKAEINADPVLFGRRILRDESWETQTEFQRAVLTSNRIAIRGCHSSSKTFSAAELTLWWLSRYRDGAVVTIAPGARQVDGLIWLEIRKARERSRIPFPEIAGSAKSGGIRLDMHKADGSKALENYAIGFSTEKGGEGVKAHGIHAAHLLIIIDEAPGVSAEVFDALEGMAAGGHCVIIMLGNPTIPGGPFYEAFTSQSTVWKTFTIDAYDTPNFLELRRLAATTFPTLSADEQRKWALSKEYLTELLEKLPTDHPAITYCPRPYLVRPSWAKERLQAWGPRSPRWESRVRGQFPSQAEDALISLRWLEEARAREPIDNGGRLSAGVDVAGPGKDETVAIVRCGPSIIAQWASAAPEDISWPECEQFLTQFKPRLAEVNVDYAGLGVGLALRLDEHGFPVNRVNVGEGSSDSEQFYLLKAELYWGLRERFKAGDVSGLADETTLSQLATLKYETNARKQVVMESKDHMAKRGVKSPDRAEAVMLAFADRTPNIARFYQEQAEAQHSRTVANDVAQATGNPAPVEDEENDMMVEYERARAEAEKLR